MGKGAEFGRRDLEWKAAQQKAKDSQFPSSLAVLLYLSSTPFAQGTDSSLGQPRDSTHQTVTLMRAVGNARLVVLMRSAGGEAELSRDPVCPSQELSIRELVAA